MSNLEKRQRRAGLPCPLAIMVLVVGVSATAGRAVPSADNRADGGQGFIVVPKRIVFDGRTRTAAMTLINTGAAAAVYRIGFVHMRMSETGEMRPIAFAEAGEAFADTLVRYAPRQVALGPKESQTIRLQLRKPADLPTGEYRFHLLVQQVPRPFGEEVPPATFAAETGAELSVRLSPVLGIAIPVIVREGPTTASVTIADFRYREGRGRGERPTATLVIRREGNRSVYGDLTLVHVSGSGHRRTVGAAKGIGIYTPNRQRVVQIPMVSPARGQWADGRLHIRYAEVAPHTPALAETSFIFP